MLKNILIRVATSAERYCNEEQKWWSQPASYSKLSPGGPIPHNLARALMPRQPYSVAVLSTGGRLHPRFLRKRGLGRKWSSPCRRDGEVEKSAPSRAVTSESLLATKKIREIREIREIRVSPSMIKRFLEECDN